MQLFRSSNEGDGSSWLHWVSCIIWFAFYLLTSSTRLTSLMSFSCVCVFCCCRFVFEAKVVSYVQGLLWVGPTVCCIQVFLSSLVTPNTKVNKMAAPLSTTPIPFVCGMKTSPSAIISVYTKEIYMVCVLDSKGVIDWIMCGSCPQIENKKNMEPSRTSSTSNTD